MEVWDLYDKNRIKMDKRAVRGSILEEGFYHVVAHVIIFNHNGEMLIQHRQKDKEGWPDLWDLTAGGSVLSGETSEEGAMREVREEIGYSVDLTNQRPHMTINFGQGFDDFYFVMDDVNLDTLVLQDEEVQDVQWANLEQIQSMILEGAFIPYKSGFVELLFSMPSNYGCIYRRIEPVMDIKKR